MSAPAPSSETADEPRLLDDAARTRATRADAPSARIIRRLNRRGFRFVQILDLVGLTAVLVGSMWVRHGWSWPNYSPGRYALSFSLTILIFITSVYFGGLYEREPRLGRTAIFPRAVRQTVLAGATVALANLVATGVLDRFGIVTERALPLPTVILGVLMGVGAIVIAANRWLAEWNRFRVIGPPRLLIAASPTQATLARSHLLREGHRLDIIGEAHDIDDIVPAAVAFDATDVLVLQASWIEAMHPQVIDDLIARELTVLHRVGPIETLYGLERIRQIGGLPIVKLRPHTMRSSELRLKRVTELLYLAVGAPLWIAALAFTAVYQLIVAGRPLLFKQTRVGADGATFEMVKFRTMGTDAERDGIQQSSATDPRVIPACRWIRATRLDELPQIWNILKGDMALVGPRPERPENTTHFTKVIPGYGRRHEVRPGLTGLAQIHGHYATDPAYKLGYDLQYVVNWSPVLDLEILLRTVWVVLTRRV